MDCSPRFCAGIQSQPMLYDSKNLKALKKTCANLISRRGISLRSVSHAIRFISPTLLSVSSLPPAYILFQPPLLIPYLPFPSIEINVTRYAPTFLLPPQVYGRRWPSVLEDIRFGQATSAIHPQPTLHNTTSTPFIEGVLPAPCL